MLMVLTFKKTEKKLNASVTDVEQVIRLMRLGLVEAFKSF